MAAYLSIGDGRDLDMAFGVGDMPAQPQPGPRAVDAGALLWALRRVAGQVERDDEAAPAFREALAQLCQAAGFAAGHALLARGRERLAGTDLFHGGFPALRDACARLEAGPGEAIAGRALQERASAWFRDLSFDPRAGVLAATGIRSALACPVLVGGEVEAVLELFSVSPAPPDPLVLAAVEQAAVLLGRVIERTHAEGSLQAGEDIFRLLCESLPVGVLLTDAGGRAVYANPVFEEITGFGVAASRDGSWLRHVHPEDRARAEALWQRALSSHPMHFELRLSGRGLERICEASSFAVRGPRGELRGFVTMVEDLTATRRAQQALRESEDRFRAIFEDAGVGLALSDGDGTLVRVNRAYAGFLGYAPEELAGRNVRGLVAPEHVAATAENLKRLASDSTPRFELEREYLRRDGTRVWGRTTVTRLADTGLLIGVVQDVDARKRAEGAVRALSGRFLRLQDEERRRIARSLHESAAQTLAALSMNLQRMERMALPQHAAEALSDSLELSTQCSREIRTLSHLLHPPLLEEAGLPSSLRWYVEGFAQRSNVEVELEISDEVGRLPMELEIALFRVAQESLTNVLRHSGSASASVRLRREGPEVVLDVEDRGVGLPPEVLERVRAHSAAVVGVGIAGMRERLSQLGGTLEIEPANPGTLVRARIRSER